MRVQKAHAREGRANQERRQGSRLALGSVRHVPRSLQQPIGFRRCESQHPHRFGKPVDPFRRHLSTPPGVWQDTRMDIHRAALVTVSDGVSDCVALVVSMIVSLTIIPVLAARFLSRRAEISQGDSAP
jgi:hypothetical protein